jgi:hypothetical protein
MREGVKQIGDAIILTKRPQTVVSPIYIDDETGESFQNVNNLLGKFECSGMKYVKGDAPAFADAWRVYPNDSAHFAPPGDGSRWARWRPFIGVAGDYRVYMWFPSEINERYAGFTPAEVATDALVKIKYARGEKLIRLNMRRGGRWIDLGVYRFEAGWGGYVEVRNDANGYVFADAVKFVPSHL